MASESDANLARKLHGGDLLRRGVHAIGVEKGEEHGGDGWVVVAYVPKAAKVDLPKTLSCSTRGGDVEVPLIVNHQESFKLD